jgi:hypothetical protein
MSEGVIYYNRGQKCIIRLATSIHSLRKYYDGCVTIIQHDKPNKHVLRILEWLQDKYDVDVKDVSEDAEAQAIGYSLQFKAYLWKYTPYDNTIFLFSDTIVLGPIEHLHTLAELNGLVFTDFCGWVTTGGKMSRRINAWRPVIGDDEVKKALNYGRAVNTGVFAFTVDSETKVFLEEWGKLVNEGLKKNCTRRILDEVACQVLLHKYPDCHIMAESKFNSSVRFGPFEDAVIIHYHGAKHVGDWAPCFHWKNHYWEMRNRSDIYDLLGGNYGDRRFRQYLKDVVKKDVTIVSAVNPKYLSRMCSNIDKWMQMEGIREQKFLIFAHGWDRVRAVPTRPIRKYKNVKVVRWDLPVADTERERMLSAFVFGVAEHVETKYWMKLDGDCTPKTDNFVWPKLGEHSVIGHRWGYTKMKHDPDTDVHWLNRLDAWFGGEPYFKETFETPRVGHRRFCTFCAIEKTAFTKRIAKASGERLPIPSQDTLSWYLAERWDDCDWHGMNMKRYFSP